mmetsp:Transcript_1780/g.3745  ORF Transcript_1780/g.3745 Transcript_1780/m.3745 type:complete len:116 (+) Transcript_1780:221-568(+)|eukprot:CAMPEP_0172615768 /NCGR_PEP_ID=MMETSP1068-20121228/62495_1 /TAXON_ID=35684 /ORGANISM="Pseudopedinella elastica, Strain CCMP716" /LENGTH=115 /DNA_ID=CAMNT_0013421015 /DNA_START=161 /DNA_END=508 /DNA_ORIENTATION=+
MPKEDATPNAVMENWKDRVNSEVASQVTWEQDWGGLYKPKEPQGYKDRIASLESKLKKMPGTRTTSVSRMDFAEAEAFQEIAVPVAGARSKELNTMEKGEILGSSGTTMAKMPKA